MQYAYLSFQFGSFKLFQEIKWTLDTNGCAAAWNKTRTTTNRINYFFYAAGTFCWLLRYSKFFVEELKSNLTFFK